MELSGPNWANKFPTSSATADLIQPFRGNTERFIAAMRGAGISVIISATFRPPERAYLMRSSFAIGPGGLGGFGIGVRRHHPDFGIVLALVGVAIAENVGVAALA